METSSQSSLVGALTTGPQTNNGALTNSTSNSYVVDFFFLLGALRKADAQTIISSFTQAFNEDQEITTKLLFYARDRNGQGERKLFRIIINHMAKNSSSGQSLIKQNIPNIPYYGRWDDLFALCDTPLEDDAIAYYAQVLRSGDPLAAKWAPREKSSKKTIALKLMKALSCTPKQYRKMISTQTTVVENKMCSNDWDSIDYSRVPSVAMSNYRHAFEKHSKERWDQYISDLTSGKTKVNSSVLYPYQIVKPILDGNYAYDQYATRTESSQLNLLNSQWNSLPDYIQGSRERILPVIDTSGSMYSSYGNGPLPIHVAIGLGLYISERNRSIFNNAFMTFSESPEMVHLSPGSLVDRVLAIKKSNWGMNTDLAKTFQTILAAAMNNHIPDTEMPTTILIISDMEFDSAVGSNTNYEYITQLYEAAGYSIPKVVFWNVNGRIGNSPVKTSDHNTLLVSGFSPVIMKHILASGSVTPLDLVADVVKSPRYYQVVTT